MKNVGCLEVKDKWGGHNHVAIYDRKTLTLEGRLAVRLLEHFAIVAATPDGEDTHGRQKLRLMSPQEAAARACDTAAAMFQQLHERDWTLELPDLTVTPAEPKEPAA